MSKYVLFFWALGRAANDGRPAYLKALVAEQRVLPAALKPGRCQALTHDTVLRRLMALRQVMNGMEILKLDFGDIQLLGSIQMILDLFD